MYKKAKEVSRNASWFKKLLSNKTEYGVLYSSVVGQGQKGH
jgi:hypothetical protein